MEFRTGEVAGIAIAWIFNLWGLADILNAFYQANHAGLLAGQLGTTYFIPTLVVPLLLITHGLAFRILLQHQPEPAMQAVTLNSPPRRRALPKESP